MWIAASSAAAGDVDLLADLAFVGNRLGWSKRSDERREVRRQRVRRGVETLGAGRIAQMAAAAMWTSRKSDAGAPGAGADAGLAPMPSEGGVRRQPVVATVSIQPPGSARRLRECSLILSRIARATANV